MSTMFKKCVNFWKRSTSTNVRIYMDFDSLWSSLLFKTSLYKSIVFQNYNIETSVFLIGSSIAFLRLFSFYDSVNKIFIAKLKKIQCSNSAF